MAAFPEATLRALQPLHPSMEMSKFFVIAYVTGLLPLVRNLDCYESIRYQRSAREHQKVVTCPPLTACGIIFVDYVYKQPAIEIDQLTIHACLPYDNCQNRDPIKQKALQVLHHLYDHNILIGLTNIDQECCSADLCNWINYGGKPPNDDLSSGEYIHETTTQPSKSHQFVTPHRKKGHKYRKMGKPQPKSGIGYPKRATTETTTDFFTTTSCETTVTSATLTTTSNVTEEEIVVDHSDYYQTSGQNKVKNVLVPVVCLYLHNK